MIQTQHEQGDQALDIALTTGLYNNGMNVRTGQGNTTCAVAVRPGRDNEPVVSSSEEGFPRTEPIDGSAFIVWSFLSRLVFDYDLG